MTRLRLPVAFKCLEGRTVDFKVDSHGMDGWRTGGRGFWVASLNEHVLHVRLTDPTSQIENFELHLESFDDGGIRIRRAHIEGFFWGPVFTHIIAPVKNLLLDPSQCANEWVGENGDVERDKGKNNNGWALNINVGSTPEPWDHTGKNFSARIWPKRDDRIRLDFRRAGGASDINLEIDTRE